MPVRRLVLIILLATERTPCNAISRRNDTRVLDTRILQALCTRTLATLTVPRTKMTLPDADFHEQVWRGII